MWPGTCQLENEVNNGRCWPCGQIGCSDRRGVGGICFFLGNCGRLSRCNMLVRSCGMVGSFSWQRCSCICCFWLYFFSIQVWFLGPPRDSVRHLMSFYKSFSACISYGGFCLQLRTLIITDFFYRVKWWEVTFMVKKMWPLSFYVKDKTIDGF